MTERDEDPRPLGELQGAIEEVVDADRERRQVFDECLPSSDELSKELPLVHRTGSHTGWKGVLRDAALRPGTRPPSGPVEAHVGHAVYFFLGSPARPKGNVVVVFDAILARERSSRFSPFDSGCLDTGRVRVGDGPLCSEMEEDERLELIRRCTGDGADLRQFTSLFLAAHFMDANEYVRRPQRSRPDYAPYHELVDVEGDRRTWTVEIRLYDEVPLDQECGFRGLIVAGRDLEEDVPVPLLRHTSWLTEADAAELTPRFARKALAVQKELA